MLMSTLIAISTIRFHTPLHGLQGVLWQAGIVSTIHIHVPLRGCKFSSVPDESTCRVAVQRHRMRIRSRREGGRGGNHLGHWPACHLPNRGRPQTLGRQTLVESRLYVRREVENPSGRHVGFSRLLEVSGDRGHAWILRPAVASSEGCGLCDRWCAG